MNISKYYRQSTTDQLIKYFPKELHKNTHTYFTYINTTSEENYIFNNHILLYNKIDTNILKKFITSLPIQIILNAKVI